METLTDIKRDVPEIPPARWRRPTSRSCAWLLAALFLVSGLWKILDLPAAAERMVQSLVPVPLSMAAAMLVGAGETFTAILLLAPRFRRWGAWLAAIMLVGFMAYIGVFYHRLLGDDCNCFPWIRRVVGPWFFAGDAAMLLLAVAAGWGAQRSRGLKMAASILAGVATMTLCSYGLSAARLARIVAPMSIEVDGRIQSLHRGRVLLYFFDPECSHCLMLARKMSRRDWGSTLVVALPTAQPRFARDFLNDAGLKAGLSPDADKLRRTFAFTDPPYAVALVDGRQAAVFNSGQLANPSFYDTIGKLGLIR
jgi:uncharacterized membrane protein YphA (DoxX/SURF4 family)